MADVVAGLMADVATIAVPVAVVIELSNVLITMFLRVAFGGRLYYGDR